MSQQNELQKSEGKQSLKQLINSEKIKEQIAKALPEHMTADRFCRVLTTTMLRVPKLAECDTTSFMKAMLDCSSLGLEPDGRLVHLIPFKNNKLKIIECQLIVDYKGLIELAKRSGEVAVWKAEIVYANDHFKWENGEIEHTADIFNGDRGEPIGAYSKVTQKDGIVDYEPMSKKEILDIKKRSKAASSGPWVTDEMEMWKKTVMRRHSKRLRLSPEFASALEKDADRFDDIRNVTPPSKELSSKGNPFDKEDVPQIPTDEEPDINFDAETEEVETSAK